ncbi:MULTISPECIES: nickel-dependent hydrogenase large subunit [unclassified Shewanella]|uniref:nickel-dependent hydrogenase large subunit n=1 Tax=unclassified Shewanella TaxID=196818 RepID=UPI000C862D55|nr:MULTISPECIES: nickel-dependent hydrogenase large subunit [unclassified Shewanella]MDO6618339.1 nickel-dependent hydrogenase large subunit [Shewanella sp. 6_MG-2023]MDO6640716.1 nickel-dependent hydrogenase large subunit [Shewanella sp. 5_MG-2023]MDO6679256.1 nickel-dependent hydrogenase large subunit [Shewanella sp. 4_MG-2023]MDO6776408.1 nickel-dependent hydrogenase large subunit [Shewanella sp. 3_MG-2023]PMG28396.1 hydrogenase 2 large subunit [Shewanella sp. 10N.286.52.C2]
MSKRVVIDPITRIEGHLRVEVEVDENNVIQKAWSSSTLWRGIEVILKGRTPMDVGLIVQRICGVCTYSHYRCGTEAVENALGVKIPLNAKYLRSLMQTSLYMHDHIVHFYHLHGLDWVDVVSALSADPALAAQEANKYTENPIATGEGELRAVQQRVKGLVDTGKLGPFANAYWGNKTYKFTPEQNLIALSHYLKALEVQRVAAEMLAIFGGKSPHPQSLVVGGVTSVRDMLSPARLQEWKQKHAIVHDFIIRAYKADIVMAAAAFGGEPSVLGGVNVKNFLATDDFILADGQYLFEQGVIMNGDLAGVSDLDPDAIKEDVTHSWYDAKTAQHPYDGTTIPNYTGFVERDTVYGKLPTVDGDGKYSWVKSPRYQGEPVEVGPLACLLVNYARGNKIVVDSVNGLLAATGLPIEALFTTLGRTAARMLQTVIVAEEGLKTFDAMLTNMQSDESTYVTPEIDSDRDYIGHAMIEAPRGMLSHWIRIKGGKIENYQAIVPTTWNSGPVDADGKVGPYEASLIGLELEDPTKPLEVIRIIHSFDPCMACAVHVMDYKGNDLGEFRIDPNGF